LEVGVRGTDRPHARIERDVYYSHRVAVRGFGILLLPRPHRPEALARVASATANGAASTGSGGVAGSASGVRMLTMTHTDMATMASVISPALSNLGE
jgi:hypothetical protein